MENVNTLSVAAICEAVGRRRISVEIGVKATAVSNAVSNGKFPAHWFDVIERLCGEVGVECPRSLFSFAGSVGSMPTQNSFSQPAASAAQSQEQNHVETPDGC